MRQETLDLLDAHLSQETAEHESLRPNARFALYRHSLLIEPLNWAKYHALISTHALTWKEFKYTDITQPDSLDSRITDSGIGIYLFIVRAVDMYLDMPSYVFYVGISGEGGSLRPLRDRLKDYFRVGGIKKRHRVHRLLSQYYRNTYVKYATTTTLTHTQLEELEANLHGFFYPIANDRDFPLELKKLRKADMR